MVDENQDKKWECPECGSMRAERRNLAAQRARLKRSSQGKAIARSVGVTQYVGSKGEGRGGGSRVGVRAGASACYMRVGVKTGGGGGGGGKAGQV